MPRFLILRKSGVHRAACFALYRALLRQKHQLQLSEDQQHLFRKPIRALFKRNSKLQSPPQISTALQLGYETIEGLHDGTRQLHVLNRIFELASPSRPTAQPKDLPPLPRTKTAGAQKASAKNAAPYPGATRALARPFENLSGRRHVPVLINANRVPFLRLKKPQPPFLSRIIRDTVKTRESRVLRAERLFSEIPIAEDEDEWDKVLYEHFGLHYWVPEEKAWEREVKQAYGNNHKLQVEAIQKRADTAAEMYAIVEQEKALAKEERIRIRDEKHKASKARRLARKGLTESEIQEKLYPRTVDTVSRDGSAKAQELPKEHAEARQPSTEEWRKRADTYKPSDEVKRLREASLRPKTDEEIAKINEARVMRKEEEAIRKAEKMKRRQEKIAFWEQKLNSKAGHSTTEHHLGKERLSMKPLKPRVEGQIDYSSTLQQPKIPPILEELRRAPGPVLDSPWRMVKTGSQNSDISRPSLYKEKIKKSQERDQS